MRGFFRLGRAMSAAQSDLIPTQVSPADLNLRINELFFSLQGETRTAGLSTVFIRLTGCPLRCSYCDTEYAFQGGDILSLEEILKRTQQYKTRHITVTGGEPLAQKNCLPLLSLLCDAGYEVSLETSGALDISGVDPRVSVVLDLKTPASNEEQRNLYSNIDLLKPLDQVKFVICDRADYDWACEKVEQYDLCDKVDDVWFSPSFGQINASHLADWIVEDQLAVRMQLQLHKLLWNDEPGR